MPITARPYANESDYERMRGLLRMIEALAGPLVYFTLGDLDWWRFTDDDPQAVRKAHLWLNRDEVVGIAWPNDTQVDLMAHPHYRTLEHEMLRWAEERHTARPGADPSFAAWGYEHDHVRTALLQQRGYARTGDYLRFNLRSLNEALPEPPLPPGFFIRNVEGEDDLEQCVEVHRAAFAPSRMTVTKHRAVIHAPTYRPDLDLVVVAPDGRFAAFCIVWFDTSNHMGIFEPVGCHPDFQRRG